MQLTRKRCFACLNTSCFFQRLLRQAFMPLYKSVPKAAMADPYLYELLALVDAIRGGRAREKNLAVKELQKRLRVD
ncbi:MAG: hypothetical protein EOM80_12680 [Erysipelotrichia bacterium]|nr:hypothetical protein [Erysipelotrichia bacterium]